MVANVKSPYHHDSPVVPKKLLRNSLTLVSSSSKVRQQQVHHVAVLHQHHQCGTDTKRIEELHHRPEAKHFWVSKGGASKLQDTPNKKMQMEKKKCIL